MTTALLVIDVQRALCTGNYAAFEADRIIDRINQVARRARSAGAPVVIIQHEEAGGLLEHGTEGWKLDPRLEALPADTYVRKKATDSFHATELQDVLHARGTTRLVICGLQSEFCIDTTTRRALALGYPVTLVADGHSTMDSRVLSAAQITAHHNETLANIDSFGVKVTALPAADIRIENGPSHPAPLRRSPPRLLGATPVLASLDIGRSVDFFCTRLGFTALHAQQGVYGVVSRDAVSVHFWACTEQHIAENTSCRVRVEGVDRLYAECVASGIVHPKAPLMAKPWGTREFAIVDPDGNLVTFAQTHDNAGSAGKG